MSRAKTMSKDMEEWLRTLKIKNQNPDVWTIIVGTKEFNKINNELQKIQIRENSIKGAKWKD